MDKTDPKLTAQVDKLEKLVDTLSRRLLRVEAENKTLKSRLIRAEQNIGSLTHKVSRGL